MIHPGNSEVSIGQILEHMVGGDVLTHAYHGNSEGTLDENGKIRSGGPRRRRPWRPVRRGARARQLLLGRRRAGARAGVRGEHDQLSDLHVYNLHGPVFDLATTVMKFVHLGLSLDEAIARATLHPAQAMGVADEVGGLRVGMAGDVAAFALEEGQFTFYDAADEADGPPAAGPEGRGEGRGSRPSPRSY